MLKCAFVVLVFSIFASSANILDTKVPKIRYDEQYASMPELFYQDNFDRCLLSGEESIFCTFTFSLEPLEHLNTTLWDVIENSSSNPQNYRHDQLRHGICIPTTCPYDYNYSDNKTLEEVISDCYNKKNELLGLKGAASKVKCQNNESRYSIDDFDITFASLVGVYLLFVIFASFYEIYKLKDDRLYFYDKKLSKATLFLSAFSIRRNWYRLRSTNSSSDHRKLKSIQGIRFFNMVLVIMTHTIMGILAGPISNPQYTEDATKYTMNIFLFNGWYVVQTFFVISGWLLSYNFFKATAEIKQIKFSYIFWAIANRYIRLVPAIAVMVGLHSSWIVHVSRGPYWDEFVGQEYRNCRKNWWTNLLFVNNYIDSYNMCLHQTWYLAADMQLFVFSVILLYIVWKYPEKMKYIFGIVLFIGFICPGVIAYVNEHDIIMRFYPEVLYNLNLLKLDQWHLLLSSGHSNIFGYTIGMIFGYLFYKYRNSYLDIRPIYLTLWWLLTFGMCISVILVSKAFYNPDFQVTPLKSALYWACGKNLFALGIAIGIFGMTQKIGWLVRSCCEFEPLQVLGRLSFSAYMIHATFIRWQMGFRRYPVTASDGMMFHAVLGDVTSSYLGAILLCLLLEMPVSALQKLSGFSANRNSTKARKSSEKSLETLDMECDRKESYVLKMKESSR